MLELIFVALFAAIANLMLGRGSHLRLRVRFELMVGLLAMLVASAYAIAKRVEGGLGAVTHLSNQVPWGIWITFDLGGVALASGGFLVAATVHLFHLRRFEPVLRPTVLTAFIAYLLVAAVLVIDLGRPQRFWHPLIMWQPHSVMFEITMCLSLYTLILALEFSPALFERLGWRGLAEGVHRLALPIVMLGVILSTLHQSSFGSLFLIVPQKLSPLWYTPLLPVFFLLSAGCAGLAVVIVESFWCARLFGQRLAHGLLVDMGRAGAMLLWLYLALRLADIVWRRAWAATSAAPWLGAALWVELIAGVALPAVWLSLLAWRRSTRGLMVAATLVIGGVVLNRMNISWFGLAPAAGMLYVPSWMELVLTASLCSLGVMAFLAIARFVPVFTREQPDVL